MRKRLSVLIQNKFFGAAVIGVIFLILELLTYSDYNIMWDARNHFFRGQAFAYFFLTGKHDYKELPISQDFARYYRDYAKSFTPNIDINKRLSKDPRFRRSIYKDEVHTFDWLMNIRATGHPVLSDIGASFFNILFYEKLGWVRDDHAYHLYGIVLVSILVAVVFYWLFISYGLFSAVIATLALATTPLFWAESHYNIKDIPLLVFFSLAIYTFWKGTIVQSKKWIIISALLAGFALGTKFNALFLPFVLIPWFIVYYFTLTKKKRSVYHRWWWLALLYPMIMFGVLYIGWPQLWHDPIGNFLNVLDYYKSVGTNIDYTPAFRTIFGINTYPSLWIFVTTYPIVIILSIVGFVAGLLRFRKTKDTLPFLFILWFLIPVFRASLPDTSIFGGVRHIIEYVPPLAMLAGIGAYYIVKQFNNVIQHFYPVQITGLLLFIPLVITLIRLHPAENVYFNSFIDGLSGAKKANLTGWGNTDGGIYRKALVWLNNNAEPNAHVAVGFSETADFYLPEFRDDLRADNQFSGYLQKGEYIVELTHNSELERTYRMMYPEKLLEPVYTYEVDGVPLIKIWKNDGKHLKREVLNLHKVGVTPIIAKAENERIYWDLGDIKQLNYIKTEFEKNASCKPLSLGYFQISKDKEHWETLPETYPGGPIDIDGEQPSDGTLIAPFAGLSARYILFTAEPENACILNLKNSLFEVFVR